jgi:hypothetical protein
VDFYWDELGLVGEADGKLKYQDDEARPDVKALWDETRRGDRLAHHGAVLARWGWPEARHPQRLDVILRRAFQRATRLRQAGVPLTLHQRCAHDRAA